MKTLNSYKSPDIHIDSVEKERAESSMKKSSNRKKGDGMLLPTSGLQSHNHNVLGKRKFRQRYQDEEQEDADEN